MEECFFSHTNPFFILLADIEADFKEYLQFLVPRLLAPENLVVKQIHGNKITGKELVEYFKVGTYDLSLHKTCFGEYPMENVYMYCTHVDNMDKFMFIDKILYDTLKE